MAQLFQQPFDANTVKPNEAFEAMPAGWYDARIVNSEAKPTKDNQSGYLQLDLEIIDGEYKNRKVFDRLNLWNTGPNAETTREIAHRQLSAYCHATGVFILQDSNQLHGIPIKIKLSVRQSEGYEPQNDVKAVKHIQDGTAAKGTLPPSAPSSMPTAPTAPFGMNPSLPTPPAPPPVAQNSQPWLGGQPSQPAQVPTQPWAPPAPSASPTQPWQSAAGTTQQPTPPMGPVPPWRK